MIRLKPVAAIAAAVGIGLAAAGSPAVAEKPSKGVEKPTPAVVGAPSAYRVVPDLQDARSLPDGSSSWSKTVMMPGATFIKAHIVDLNLRAGDSLVLRTHSGRVVETLTGLGPKNAGTFWGLSAPGDSLVLELNFSHPYSKPPFSVDQIIAGDQDLFAAPVEQGQRSICSPGDFEDAICYEEDAAKWQNVQASVGVMSVGGNANSALFCSGANVSPDNYILTNQHCVETQSVCDNTEYVFKFYRTGCNDGSPTTPDWQSFRCDTVVASEPFINCDAGPGDLDYTLTSIIGDAAATYGYAEVDTTTPITSGEDIYIIQHPAGRPHEITHGGGTDFQVDGSVLRYFATLDTEGGSSGSPLFRDSDDKLIGLHHCGGCSDPAIGNRGMSMADIAPQIENFICSPELTLRASGAENLQEVSGNGNAVVEPGETWQFTPTVRNVSCDADATGVTATLALGEGSSDAIITNPAVSFGFVAAGTSAQGAPVQFQVAGDAPCGSEVVFDLNGLTATNGGPFEDLANVLSAPIGEEVLETAYLEDYSVGLTDWTVVDGGGGTGPAQTWTTGNPGNRSLGLTAPYVIVDSDSHGIGLLMDEQLISPTIDASGYEAVTLNFRHELRWYSGGLDEQADVDVRSSATGGGWVNIANYSGGSTSGAVSIDITDYAASDLQVRFYYYNAEWEWWWAIDDVTIRGSNGFVCDVNDDTDGDGTPDTADNCTLVSNADQRDTNGDGFGNACDADLNDDGVINFSDLGLLKAVFFTSDDDADFNGDGAVNFTDLATMKDTFFGAPGPSGLAR